MVESNQEIKLVKVLLNQKQFSLKKLPLSMTLPELRTQLQNIPVNARFYLENMVIEQADEAIMTLADILFNGNEIHLMSSQKEDPNPMKIKNQPLPNAKFLTEKNGLKIYLYPQDVKLNQIDEANSKVLMVVGQTGCGKTTLLNAYINYLMNIQYEDDFRYNLIDESHITLSSAHSQTSDVTCYYVASHNGNPSFKIVDTPGFGDTRGFDQDKIIFQQISDHFKNKLDCINAICFVAQSSNARLTTNQKYIFSSILNLFGNDVAENFVCMLTFCDGADPQIVAALQEKDSIFSQVIPQIKQPWYLQFNNSAIYATRNLGSMIQRTFWDMGMNSFKDFTDKIKGLNQKSLVLTKEVLQERKKLEHTICQLQPQISEGLSKMSCLDDQIEQVRKNESLISQNKDFTITIQVPYVDKVPLKAGVHTTTCIKCNFTCHEDCAYSNSDEKKNCSAITDSYCTVCPKKCHYTDHSNVPYKFVYGSKAETQNLKDLEAKYCQAKSDKSKIEQIIRGTIQEIYEINKKVLQDAETVRKCVNRISQIALKKEMFDQLEYIDLLINSEQLEKKKGYGDRINALEKVKLQISQIKTIINADQQQDSQLDLTKKMNQLMEENKDIFEQQYLTDIDKKQKSCQIF